MNAPNNRKDSVLTTNRKAKRNYEIVDYFEAGIALVGTEVKSVRDAKVSIDEAFAMIHKGEMWLHQARIEPYTHGNQFNHDPVRQRKLLMHRKEIDRIQAQVQQKNYTLVALDMHLKHGKVKVKLGLGKGKDHADKRETLKKRSSDRDAQRAIVEAKRR